MPTMLYFTSILLTGALAGFLAFYAWRQRGVPGSRAYAGLALGECLLALAEILSMLSPTPALALFWFQVRYLCLAVIPVFWLVFALAYSGRKNFISKRLLAGLFIVPVSTQVLLWSNHLHGLWVKQEVGFHQNGPFWLAEIGARLPGLGFLTHAFYGLILLLAGIALFLITAWRVRQLYHGQALLLAGAGLTAGAFAANSVFNLIPQPEFNLFTPGLGLSVLLIALAVFRFQFLQRAPTAETGPKTQALERQTQRSLAVFLLIFMLMATGIATVSYLSYQNYERQFRVQMESQLASIAELKVRELETWRAERLADAEVMRQNPAFAALAARCLANPADTQAQAQMQAWLDALRNLYHYDRVFLLDAAGVEWISSPAAPEPVAAHLTEELPAILSAEQVTFLDFHRDTAAGPIHLALLVPILAPPDNHPLGLLVLRIDPNLYLYPFIQQWPVPSPSAETLLVRREGTDVLFLNELKFQANTALNLRVPLEDTQILAVKAALGQAGLVEGLDYRGAPVIGVACAVPDSPWFLVARMDTAEVYAPLRERLWQTAVFFGALLAAAGTGLGLVWRQQRARYYRGQVAAAQALRESEQRFREFFESQTNYCYRISLDGVILDLNSSAWRALGYASKDDIIGQPLLTTVYAPASRDRARQLFLQWQETGELRNEELSIITQTGEERRVILNVSAVRDTAGKLLYSVSIQTDITARKLAEEALRASEARFSTIFHASPAAIALTRLGDSQFIDVNEAWQALTGYTRAEAIGHTPFELNLWVNPARRQRLTETLRAQGTARDEVQIRRKSGETGDVLMSAELIELAGERYLLTMAQDITARKRTEEALRESEERLRLITENMSDTVWLMDMDLQTVFISPSVERLRGYTLAELQALPLDKQLTPPSLAQAMTMMAQELTPARLADKNTPIVVTVELEFYRKNSSTFWSENSFTVIRNLDGRPVAILGVGRDITDRKQAREKIKQQLNELQRWHDLTLDRETRALELKSEVNELLRRLHEPIRYPSAEA